VDRIAAAAAAFASSPDGHAAVVADAGTAITVDAVDAGGTFRGGIIAPGLRLGLQALRRGTSLLPQVELNPGAPLLGTSTRACLEAGALHGGAALLDGLCERMADLLGGPVTAWLTGGDADVLRPLTRRFGRCDPALVLRGLALAWQRRAPGHLGAEH
jgi:type III pantothenate kinase